MTACALCQNETPASELQRVSGLDFCGPCRASDPTERLAEHGIAAEWNPARMRFSAGMGLPGQQADFYLKCVPETFSHQLVKVGFQEVEVGDPIFDDAVFVRTNNPERAASVLAPEGVQSVIVALLSDVRTNDLLGNHVTLEGPTLQVSTAPLGGMSEERTRELILECAALALHLKG